MNRTLAVLLCASFSLSAAEPDWTKWNPYALDLLQRYIRIASVDPPADTRPTGELIRSEFEKRGFHVTVYTSGPLGQTNLVIRLKGRDSAKKASASLQSHGRRAGGSSSLAQLTHSELNLKTASSGAGVRWI